MARYPLFNYMGKLIKVNFKKQSNERSRKLLQRLERNYFIKELAINLFIGMLILSQVMLVGIAIVSLIK